MHAPEDGERGEDPDPGQSQGDRDDQIGPVVTQRYDGASQDADEAGDCKKHRPSEKN